MLPISILERTANSIVYEMPAGKPNPHLKREPDRETRERVYQSASKLNTCWYYTFNFIRPRSEKEPSDECAQEREIEKRCSLRRKEVSNHEKSLSSITEQLNNEKATKLLKGIDLEKAKLYVQNKKTIKPMFDAITASEGGSSLFSEIEEFLTERKHKNMYEFLLAKKFGARLEINTKFLSDFKFDAKTMYESDHPGEWEDLDMIHQSSFSDFFALEVSADKYGLKKSSWTPLSGIDGLIAELKKNGPLTINGKLGQYNYVDPCFKMNQKLADRDIYAWKPGAKRLPGTAIGHAVLLIGAKKAEGREYVYFIDPMDPSDPKDRSVQKIYMISFKNLTSNLCDIRGYVYQDSPSGYSYHGRFDIPAE